MAVTSQEWMARAAALELVSMGLLVPTAVLAEALVSGEYEDAAMEASVDCGLDLVDAGLSVYKSRDADELFHELRREHTCLFSRAPEPLVTPFVGVWFARERGQRGLLFVGRESVAIERFMRRCGVAKNLSSGHSNDPVDHIGTVCEFMKYLCLVNARAIATAEGFEVREGDFEEFHREHFREYATWCARRIRECEPSAFYAFVAGMLEQVAVEFA